MHLIYIDETQAVALIARAASNLPEGWSLGAVFAVGEAGIMARDGELSAVIGVDDEGTWRVVTIGEHLQEITRWRDGVEVSRGIGRVKID